MPHPRNVWIAAGAAALPIVGAALYLYLNYEALPDPYPRHWNWRGVADGFGPKTESAVFTVPLIGVVTLVITLAVLAAQTYDLEGKQPVSATQTLAIAWFLSFVMTLVSLLPVIVPPSGAPWLLPAILIPAAGVVAISIRDQRRARRARDQGVP
jgi:uncharacterized membrane protein